MKNIIKKEIVLILSLFLFSGCSEKLFNQEILLNSYTTEKTEKEITYNNIDTTDILKVYRNIFYKEFNDEVMFFGYRDKLIIKYTQAGYTDRALPEIYEYQWIIECKKEKEEIKTKIIAKRISDLKDLNEEYLNENSLINLTKKAEKEINDFIKNNNDIVNINDFKKEPEKDVIFENKIVKVKLENKENILDFKEDIVNFEEFEKISITNQTIDKSKLENIIKDTDIKEENLNKIEPLPELKINKGE